ncbi:class I histocompatibility antigen, F10 alpha chain-like isoform X1 [Anomalospiza imberbis]|uniref:class I histocompatibility antigen, F10 alpha chain-like isoform X1 n=1 Tax=Anomalospiza imberbis TaxID=187417 RepID=UPI00358DFA44
MAPALGLGVLLGLLALLGDPGAATKVLHSLHYLQVAVSEPSPGVPQFTEMGFVDGIPFVRYDSERERMEPQMQWIKDGVDQGYWEGQTQNSVRSQHTAARNLETLRERYNQSGGLHTHLVVYGCDLLSDGSVRGSVRYGYDGQDFISFDLGSGRFVAADSAAEITRRRWEQEEQAERWMNYLKLVCPEWLQKYLGYGQKELEHKEPPDVHVSGKEEHGTLILSCHAYGFYPNTIAVNWMKGDEIWDQETEWGGIVPNSDGTFHTWARIEALPEEREQYRCRVEHPSMLEPGIFAWEPTSGGNLIMVVAVSIIAATLFLVILIGFVVWKRQSGNTWDGGWDGKGHGSTRHCSGNPVPPTLIPLCFHREEGQEWIQCGSRKGHGNEWLDRSNHRLSDPWSWIQPLSSQKSRELPAELIPLLPPTPQLLLTDPFPVFHFPMFQCQEPQIFPMLHFWYEIILLGAINPAWGNKSGFPPSVFWLFLSGSQERE